MTPKIILDFTNAGGNILLGLSSSSGTPTAIVSLLLELDVQLSTDRHAAVIDHFSFDSISSTNKHDTLLLPRPQPLRSDVKDFFGGSGLLALPKAVGHVLGNTSPLLTPILRAPETAYSYNHKEDVESVEDPFATGSQLALVSAMQARNSARFTVLGSLEMLQDQWFTASVKGSSGVAAKTSNQDFAKQLTEWTFKEVGVLRAGSVTHYESDHKPVHNNSELAAPGENNPTIYRIKNDVVSIWTRCSDVRRLIIQRHSRLKCPNGPTINGSPFLSQLVTISNSSSTCSLRFIGSHFSPSALLPMPHTSAPHLHSQINTASSPSRSIISGPSLQTSRRSVK